eukprot:TRINITY_DN68056_c0_g1_i1.p1 TRINITY_DN68056_c0_g1~~TRINITY_DN68056_c0_g1_i1.p1  ORF type:complete len:694 (+),score=89.99 TRINITY_DN68056_c0_g1_i1:74-2155(+)
MPAVRAFIFWGIAAFGTSVAAQSCSQSAAIVLTDWCERRCSEFFGYLCLRLGGELFPVDSFHEGDALSVWEYCPDAQIGLRFALNALRLRKEAFDKETLLRTEKDVVDVLLINLTHYFDPLGPSFAPYFHIWHLLGLLKKSMLLEAPHSHLEESVGSAGVGSDCPALRPPTLLALRRYITSERVMDLAASSALAETFVVASGGVDRGSADGWGHDEACGLARAALLFAAADLRRPQRPGLWWEQDAEDARRHLRAAMSRLQVSVLRLWRRRRVLTALATSPAPLLEMMDRLDLQVWVPLYLESGTAEWREKVFWMRVLPSRNIEANHVRGTRRLHCDSEFQRFLLERHNVTGRGISATRPFRIVEVGAHLGGCTFYALTHLGPFVDALAIEPYGPAAEAVRLTAEENRLTRHLRVAENFVTDSQQKWFSYTSLAPSFAPWLQQPDWTDEHIVDGALASQHLAVLHEGVDGADGSNERTSRRAHAIDSGSLPAARGGKTRVHGVSLAELLWTHGFDKTGGAQVTNVQVAVDMLRVHVLGRELEVLRSAAPLFVAHSIRSVAVAIFGKKEPVCQRQDAGAIGRFLRHHGFAIRFGDAEGGEAESLLNEACATLTEGTATLTATLVVREHGQPRATEHSHQWMTRETPNTTTQYTEVYHQRPFVPTANERKFYRKDPRVPAMNGASLVGLQLFTDT